MDEDRRFRTESIRARQDHKRTSHAEFCTTQKRTRKRESSDSDADAQWTTTKDYVRNSVKTSSQSCGEIVIAIPPSNIDKSLYSPYLPRSPYDQVLAGPDFRASTRSEDHDQSHTAASEIFCRLPKRVRAECMIPVSKLRNGFDRLSNERSVETF